MNKKNLVIFLFLLVASFIFGCENRIKNFKSGDNLDISSHFIVENNYNNTARAFLSVNECRTNCFVDCLIQDDSYIIDKISSNFNDAYNCLKKKDFKLPIISQELIDSYECDYSELFYFYENDCFTPILYTENYKTQTLAVYDLNSGVELPNPEHYYLAEDLYE